MNLLFLFDAFLLLALSFWLQRRPYLATTQRKYDERRTYAYLGIVPALAAIFSIKHVFTEAYPQLSQWWVLLGIGLVSLAVHLLYIRPARRRAAGAGIDVSF